MPDDIRQPLLARPLLGAPFRDRGREALVQRDVGFRGLGAEECGAGREVRVKGFEERGVGGVGLQA